MSTAVYFNLDGTLTQNTEEFEDIFAEAIATADLDAFSDAYQDYTDRFFSFFQKGWAYPRRQAMLQLLRDDGTEDLGQTDAFANAWEDAESEATTAIDGASKAVSSVAADHHTGIATNGTGRLQRMKIELVTDTEDLDTVLISSEMGIAKPDDSFFGVMMAAGGADTTIIVSHDLRRDILPAKQAGLQTIWVSDAERDPQIEQLVDRQVPSITDVPGAVEELAN